MAYCPTAAPGIDLPPNFCPTTPAPLRIRSYVVACIDFLTSPLVSSLLECHPNDIAVEGPRPEWAAWWNWAAGGARWKFLVPGWSHDDDMHPVSASTSDVPIGLRQMLETIDHLTLPRIPDSSFTSPSPEVPIRGMSPKKAHEVSQMSAFIGSMISQNRSDIKHIVDVGAGQGYLSRALSDHPLSMNVLALDFSEVQNKGAERRGNNIEKRKAKVNAKRPAESDGGLLDSNAELSHGLNSAFSPIRAGTVTHEMIHINPQTLDNSVTRWVSALSSPFALSSSPTPVLLVALHACGTLTPDVLRCFLSCDQVSSPQSRNQQTWYPAGLVVVGCCYNLMSPGSDFPLSATVSEKNEEDGRTLVLSYNHRSLAAQSPRQWTLNEATRTAAELAIRKVIYRALFGRLAAFSPATKAAGISPYDNYERPGKIGRLRDSAYTSFQVFITEASKKIGAEVPLPVDDGKEDIQGLTSCLEVLHVLRSRVGPVVESLILVDRWLYLVENMPDVDVRAVSLFDQKLGSARNVALVVPPRITSL